MLMSMVVYVFQWMKWDVSIFGPFIYMCTDVMRVYVAADGHVSSSSSASLRVPTRHVRDFSTFSVRPSSRCTLAANVVGKDLDIFAGGAVSLNHILQACTKPFTTLLD
jgi:hypothetical protein